MRQREYEQTLASIIQSLPESKRENFMQIYTAQSKNPVIIFGCAVWLGGLGIDRFLLGQPILGIIKLITFGGFYIWAIIDLFLVSGVARKKNIELALNIKAMQIN